ncbi:unnamed protein product [Dibothriocephalus latus]|uniref:MARVEL domain-containing protein n=1 Tax=Dibothriocephalus latus TaxID=60516 RepID=A0A3P7KXM0_DIBLA|nr:unnamed protein product [Dibothriocephalus latus]
MEGTDIGILVGTILALLFLILGVAIERWTCGGVLGNCVNFHNSYYLAIGVLLVLAIILIAFALLFLILDLTVGDYWMGIAAVVFGFIGAVLALIAMLIYYIAVNPWISPILATIGMAFAVAVAILMVMQRV